MNDNFQQWLRAAGVRALRTFAQSFAGIITAYNFLGEVDWIRALSAATLAAIYSLCMSASGLPEIAGGDAA